MPDSTPRNIWKRRSVTYAFLAAIFLFLISLRIVSTLGHNFPLGWTVYMGAIILAATLFLVDRAFPFSDKFLSCRSHHAEQPMKGLDWLVITGSLSTIAVLISYSFGSPINTKLTDFFHEGEILAGFPIVQHAIETPILIHGPGRNLLPGALAAHFAQPGYEIAFMRFITGIGAMMTLLLISVTTYIFAFLLLEEMSTTSRRHSISAMASLLATFIAFTQAHVTNRHILYLLALALAAGILYAACRKKRLALVLSIGLGIVCAFAPIHVYATGLEALVIALATAVILIWQHGFPAFRLIGAALAGLTASISLVFFLGGGELYANALRDVLWWAVEARGIWSLPLSGHRAAIHTSSIIMTMAITAYLAVHFARSDTPSERLKSALLILLTVAIAVAARDMLERSDTAHTGFSLLTTAIGIGIIATPFIQKLIATRLLTTLAVFGFAAFFVAAGGYGKIHTSSSPQWVQLDTPDSEILPEDTYTFTRRYSAELSQSKCLLVLTNEGVLNYAADLPPCGNFFYPIYASVATGDQKLASWLRTNPQHIAVIKTDFWSDNIDKKSMNSRLPKVWSLLEQTLPTRKNLDGRVIAVRQ